MVSQALGTSTLEICLRETLFVRVDLEPRVATSLGLVSPETQVMEREGNG